MWWMWEKYNLHQNLDYKVVRITHTHYEKVVGEMGQ